MDIMTIYKDIRFLSIDIKTLSRDIHSISNDSKSISADMMFLTLDSQVVQLDIRVIFAERLNKRHFHHFGRDVFITDLHKNLCAKCGIRFGNVTHANSSI